MRVVEKHIALIFHRFLKGNHKINIFINGKAIEPFDPFHSTHIATQELQEEIINLNDENLSFSPSHPIKPNAQNIANRIRNIIVNEKEKDITRPLSQP